MICKMREHAESNVCSELAQAPAGTDHKRLRINRCRVLQLRRGIAARNRFEGPPSCGDAGPVSKTQLADDLGAMVLSPLLSGTAQRRAASRRSAPAARAMAEPAVEPASGSPPTARALSVDLQGPVPRRPPLPPLVAVPPGGPNIPEQRRSRGPVAATCPSILYRGALLGRQLWFLVPHLILLEITFRGWVARAGHSAGHSAPGQSWRHGRPRPCLIPQLSPAPPPGSPAQPAQGQPPSAEDAALLLFAQQAADAGEDQEGFEAVHAPGDQLLRPTGLSLQHRRGQGSGAGLARGSERRKAAVRDRQCLSRSAQAFSLGLTVQRFIAQLGDAETPELAKLRAQRQARNKGPQDST